MTTIKETQKWSPGLPTFRGYSMPSDADLPVSRVSWEINPSSTMLLVHDMQPFFLAGYGDEPPVETLTENVSDLIQRARAVEVPVAYTLQPGNMSASERGLVADFWGPGMARSDEDRLPRGALAPASNDAVFTKWRYSAFHQSGLDNYVHEKNVKKIILCGVYADIGILATAIDAYSRDLQVFLVADAIADFTREDHEHALGYISNRCGRVVSTKDVLDSLGWAAPSV
ncbi:isochorismatase family protein [Kocuria varians]|uniref:isochorismatase family protein n=1 Tax=Kocuria varians TaxID=1272 RepID=UPI0009EED9F7|nr:isochorismatase family protein [Kocuria varians]